VQLKLGNVVPPQTVEMKECPFTVMPYLVWSALLAFAVLAPL
jgi:hypothetical protein